MTASVVITCHRCGRGIEDVELGAIAWPRPGDESSPLRRPVILCKRECLRVIPVDLPWVELARFLFETESAEWERWFGGEPSRLDPPNGDGRARG